MNPAEIGRVGILAGGPSNEREISLESGKAVLAALKGKGSDAVFFDIKDNLTVFQAKAFNIDVAFIALHGRFGEDGTVQKIMEEAGIPYTGSGPLASKLALDKIASREIFLRNGIDCPEYKILNKNDYTDFKKITQIIGLPLVVKPQFEGSSIGISIVDDERFVQRAVEKAFEYGDKVILEKYIKGRELTVGILEDKPLPVIEIVVEEQFYDFTAKYKSDATRYIAPARVDSKQYREALAKAALAHRVLGCRSFSRVDMILDEKAGKIFVLELNSIPGLTSHSLLPKAAACAGISFADVCLKILESALKFKKKGSGKFGQEIQKV